MVTGREGRFLDLSPEEGGTQRENNNGGRQASGSPRPRMPVGLLCPGPGPIVSIQPLQALFLRSGGGGLTEPFWVGAWDGRVGSSRALRAEAAGGVAAWASHCSPAQQGPWHGLLPPTVPSPWALLEEGLVLALEKAETGPVGAPGVSGSTCHCGSTLVRWEIPQYLSKLDILFPGGYFTFQSLGSQLFKSEGKLSMSVNTEPCSPDRKEDGCRPHRCQEHPSIHNAPAPGDPLTPSSQE